jgi:hypothetical protein
LTFESGLLVWPVAAAAYSRRRARYLEARAHRDDAAGSLAYVTFRMGYLNKQVVAYGQRTTGFGAGTLSPRRAGRALQSQPDSLLVVQHLDGRNLGPAVRSRQSVNDDRPRLARVCDAAGVSHRSRIIAAHGRC